jgi:ribosomal protein L37E
MNKYDPRYAHVTCRKCGRKYQRIDYSSALHIGTCGYPTPEQVEPMPEKQLSLSDWQRFDSDNGIA